MTNEVYFENVLDYGDLYLDKVFNDFEHENIIFTCKNESENYFFVVCYDFRFKLEWILCKTDAISLINLISKKIDLHSIFRNSDKLVNIVCDSDGERVVETKYENFNMNFLPTPGIYLKPSFDLSYYFFDLFMKYVKPKTLQADRYIEFCIDSPNDELIYTTDCSSIKMHYNIGSTNDNINEYSRVNLFDAA